MYFEHLELPRDLRVRSTIEGLVKHLGEPTKKAGGLVPITLEWADVLADGSNVWLQAEFQGAAWEDRENPCTTLTFHRS